MYSVNLIEPPYAVQLFTLDGINIRTHSTECIISQQLDEGKEIQLKMKHQMCPTQSQFPISPPSDIYLREGLYSHLERFSELVGLDVVNQRVDARRHEE